MPKNIDDILSEFDKRYDQYNPKNDLGGRLPIWNGGDYEDIKQFIRTAIEEFWEEICPEIINKDNNLTWNNCIIEITDRKNKFFNKTS